MIYEREVLNRQTGELVSIDAGDWITVTELGECLDLGSRQIRKLLNRLGWVEADYSSYSSRGAYRINDFAVRCGFGRRITPAKGFPFDIISPAGQDAVLKDFEALMAAEEAEKATDPLVVQSRRALDEYREDYPKKLVTLREEVDWLDFHCPGLEAPQVALVLDTNAALVRKHRSLAEKQRRRKRDKVSEQPEQFATA
jgi:hypothetical protein